ncbi:DUF4041 domain-containing protein [Actinophytocola algeriensis]|uniref:Multidrug efflux pump subunit AcrA (Membrane-fusion protein) n=1 Tax=Actinophytocola algeriensis TaxID=1768010 RepID=A0A7W7VGY7_9PSEU|nr:DUF4041 domain-containing protein [Actinophytocola algeriensis]MBB4909853.1 multidrug efflux pump subunit AcrA (membrane-fusion protein) [Actinophytocola algeriensis]MBE1475843.1 multidrug efflux pump subunit AcrA (membrane-fusion protein) [Actinophytocola algeriensis]
MFGTKTKQITDLRQHAAGLQTQLQQAHGQLQQAHAHLAQIGAMEHWQVRQEIDQMRAEMTRLSSAHAAEKQRYAAEIRHQQDVLAEKISEVRAQVAQAQQELVPFTDEMVFQQAGVFRYHHPLENAEAYRVSLEQITSEMKQLISAKQAVDANYAFTFNNSQAQGRKMVNDWCKMMLRAYNSEAENCLRVMKAGSVDTAKKRLDRIGVAIEKLGGMLSIRISSRYRRLRMMELELTADYLLKKQEEKEAERAERERLREEAKAQAEFRREIEKLEKERKHLMNVRQALLDKGDEAAAAKMAAELENVEAGLQGLHDREANIRAGYVYVISNLGAFGPNMVKVGMTRRLNPMERVLELGDASVPFRYDTHIMFYSPDAVSLENALHHELSAQRVNKVNMRREFFYTTPTQVHELLKKHAGQVLEYLVDSEALEFRQSTIPA